MNNKEVHIPLDLEDKFSGIYLAVRLDNTSELYQPVNTALLPMTIHQAKLCIESINIFGEVDIGIADKIYIEYVMAKYDLINNGSIPVVNKAKIIERSKKKRLMRKYVLAHVEKYHSSNNKGIHSRVIVQSGLGIFPPTVL
jgi:hypothetical protein